MKLYGIMSKTEKIDDGFHKLSACFRQCHLYRKWGDLDHLMLWNIMGMISRKTLNDVYFIC